MEWATQWHGPEGKIHADKRTVEYIGRGNHSVDAVSFVGAISVAQAHAERSQRDEDDRLRHAPCLATPFSSPVASKEISKEAVMASNGVDQEGSGDTRSADSKKTKYHSNSNGKPSTSRKKRRVGAKETHENEGDHMRGVLQLPVYYFEIQVLATRHFQEDPGDVLMRPSTLDSSRNDGNSNQEDEDDDEENEDDDSEMKDEDDDDDDSDEVMMGVDLMEPALGEIEAHAPWRGRARRLIHEHLRATTQTTVATGNERGSSSASGGVAGLNGNGAEATMDIDSGDSSNHYRGLEQQSNGNGSVTHSRSVRSPTSALSPPSPPQLTHQQLLLSFPLSSSTIHQIRLRLERQHQQAQAQRRRFSSSGSAESGSVSLTSTISSIHARHRRDAVRRKRSNHRIAVGFMFSKHGGEYKRDICHDELGRQACGIAFVGKTGAIVSNGQNFLQTDARFGHGDTVGCGVILDTRTFFWTINGRLVATIPVSVVHHLDDYEDHSDSKETEWFTPWAEHLLPSVSLHEHGECVRALFATTASEHFRFDLDSFQQQQLKDRQAALSADASAKTQNTQAKLHGEEDIMHKLIEDYFVHFGYGNALSAIRELHRGSPVLITSRGSDSITLRHTIRQLIYSFKTREALSHVESEAKQLSTQVPFVLLHSHFLCIVDILYEGHSTKRKGSNIDAIRTAQQILQQYLSEESGHDEHLDEVRAFMSVLLYPSVEEIPGDCPGRRYLTWQFREETADALNDALSVNTSEPCALEKMVDDLSELQRQCLTCGVSPFPPDENNFHASRYSRGQGHGHRRQFNSSERSADGSDDDNDDESQSSSSNESENDDDDDDDDE